MTGPQTRIGMIGLDTSHAEAFTRILNDPNDPNHLPGARVVAGYPGGTPGWSKSADRVEGFTKTLRDDYGVSILDSPQAVADEVDLVFITAVDGREHRTLLEQVIDRGKPVFVDKPFATDPEDAQAMIEAARRAGVALMSCSSLRFADSLQKALTDDASGPIVGIDVSGPMALDDALPGMFWYGCHGVEMILAAMGPGIEEVRAVATQGADVHTFTWGDGRLATYRGMRGTKAKFAATIHREGGTQQVDTLTDEWPYYVGLLEAILGSLPDGRSAVPEAEMLQAVQAMAAANEARDSGSPVTLKPVMA